MNGSRWRADRGVTMIEVTLMLTVTVALIGALVPSMTATVRHAEIARALTDMNNIFSQTLAAGTEMGQTFTINGTPAGTWVEIVVTDGDIPRDVSATGSAEWQRPVDNVGGLVDFLERHIVTNNPRGNPANAYNTGGGNPWRGPYMSAPIDSDPWGNRYAINTEWALDPGLNDTVVYSAGPDEQIDSAYAANPLTAGDDDLVVLVLP
jgi:Flp pilus assembly pilin Flp